MKIVLILGSAKTGKRDRNEQLVVLETQETDEEKKQTKKRNRFFAHEIQKLEEVRELFLLSFFCFVIAASSDILSVSLDLKLQT